MSSRIRASSKITRFRRRVTSGFQLAKQAVITCSLVAFLILIFTVSKWKPREAVMTPYALDNVVIGYNVTVVSNNRTNNATLKPTHNNTKTIINVEIGKTNTTTTSKPKRGFMRPAENDETEEASKVDIEARKKQLAEKLKADKENKDKRAKKKYILTYDDPDKYQGPIVEGWPPSRNRSISLYLRPTEDSFLVRPTASVLRGCKLLVVVHTSPGDFKTRKGIRDTFGQYVYNKQAGDTCMIFLFGSSTFISEQKEKKKPVTKPSVSGSNATSSNTTTRPAIKEAADVKINSDLLRMKLNQEHKHYGDILVADFVDSYNNLTLKTMFTLKYFANHSNFPDDTGPEYLFKVDSDTYLNLPSLWRTLYDKKKSAAANVTNLLMGSKFSKDKMLIPARVPFKKRHEKYAGKWVCPKYMYNGRRYPEILSGSGYVMSRSAAECLYREGLKLPFFHLEDVLVTGFAAEQCNLDRLHNDGFRHLPTKLRKIRKHYILLHYVNEKKRIEIFKKAKWDDKPVELPVLEPNYVVKNKNKTTGAS